MSTNTLSQLLAAKGMKLVDLAGALKVDKSTVTRWSKGEVPVDRLIDVERVTGIPRTELRPDLAALFSERQPEAVAS